MATQLRRTKQEFLQSLSHAARTTVAALVSLLVARAFRLPEAYWSTIMTLVVVQSTLGAALTVSWQRFAGTALGAAMAVLLAAIFGPTVIVFGAGVFLARGDLRNHPFGQKRLSLRQRHFGDRDVDRP